MRYLRPCIALQTMDWSSGGYAGAGSYQAIGNPRFVNESRTPYVRLWVQWRHLQPHGPRTNFVTDTSTNPYWPTNPPVSPAQYTQWLDWGIQAARRDGKKIILTIHATPDWANYHTRMSGDNPANRPNYNAPPDNVQPTHPDGTSTGWGFLVWALATRYNPISPTNPGVSIDFLEVCNEPNLEWWPQVRRSDGSERMHIYAAEMIKTARKVTRHTGNQPIIMGPAISDTDRYEVDRGLVDGERFTRRVLSRMRMSDGWREDGYVAWTMHNYGDIRDERYGSASGARKIRLALNDYGWNGWGNNASQPPYVLITEGGSLLDEVGFDQTRQAQKVANGWEHAYDDTEHVEARGVGMFSQYRTWSGGDFDSGLCDWYRNEYDPYPWPRRPVFFRWRNLPTNAPR